MNPVPEWITRSQADALMWGVLLLGILVGIGVALWARRRGTNPAVAAALFGGPCISIGLLWNLYNFITDKLGLDSAVNLWVNLVLLVGVGAAFGIFARRFSDTQTQPQETVERPSE
ncbi:MAG: hypothetical protein OHK0029_42420 [Armatimonadaceae bacterium]